RARPRCRRGLRARSCRRAVHGHVQPQRLSEAGARMTVPPRHWFFVHLHKTAGTSLLQRLRVALGDDAVYPTVSDNWTYFATMDLDLLRRRFVEQVDRIRVITGHFPLCTTELLGAPFVTFTVLRDPVERTLSALRDMRERD